MKTMTKRLVSMMMVLALALSCVIASGIDAQAASKSKSITVKGPKDYAMLQWNVVDSKSSSAIDTKVTVTVKVLSVGKGAKSVKIFDYQGKNAIKISGKNLKKGYTKSVTLRNQYGTERYLTIDGNVKIKITLKPKKGKISFFEEAEDAG